MSWTDPLRNTPKPLVEEHYHIQKLIEAQQKRANDRTEYREREKARDERLSELRDAKPIVINDFYCDQCRKDFKAVAVIHIEDDWTCAGQLIALYKSKCRTCSKWSARLVLDKFKDPFYYRSRAVRLDRGKYHADLVQPHEDNFNLLYGKPSYTR
jgi:hypothetical protein